MAFCPHCRQPLPEPSDRFCPNCGGDVLAAGPPPPPPVAPPAVVPPSLPTAPIGAASGGAPPGTEPGTPWERRSRSGFIAALVDTTRDVLTAPTAFFRGMPTTGGLGSPLLYGLILGYAGLVAGAIYDTIFRMFAGSALTDLTGGSELRRLLPFLEGGATFVIRIVSGPLVVIIALFIGAGLTHLLLLLLGGARREFETTFRVLCYGQATAVFQVVPFCGGMIALVYGVVVVIVGLSEAHGTSRGIAAAAVLLPIVLLCCCCAGLVATAVGFGGWAAGLRQ